MTSSYHYLGNDDEVVPHNVERLTLDPSFQVIPKDMVGFHRSLVHVNLQGLSLLIRIGNRAFSECTSLKQIEIPPTVKVIGDAAFYNCCKMETVLFLHRRDGSSSTATDLHTIEESAFKLCLSLNEIEIPESVERIGEDAFLQCESMTRVSFSEGGRLHVIGSGAFAGCADLDGEIRIPSTVHTLGDSAFEGCDCLQTIHRVEGGEMKVIGEMAFTDCYRLEFVSVPSTITAIQMMTFQSCHMLKLVELQAGLKYVQGQAFSNCEGLSSISIPSSVVHILSYAFNGCHNLVSVELACQSPARLRIEDSAFGSCRSLVNISLSGDMIVHQAAFGGCTLLEFRFGDGDIAGALEKRFDGAPIHELCYHPSSTTVGQSKEVVASLAQSGGDYRQGLVDKFGMTPFHVLLSASKGRADLLKILLDAYPSHILGSKDNFGMLATGYLQRNYWNESSRCAMQMTLERWMVDSISDWGGLEAWKSDLSERVDAIVTEDDQPARDLLLAGAIHVFARYEQIETTSCLELALWKNAMTLDLSPEDNGIGTTDRDLSRIRCGVAIVLPTVLEFLL